MDSGGPERMAEIVTAISVLGEVLSELIVKLASATADEIPGLRAQAEALTERVTEYCADSAAVGHLPPEEATAIRSELLKLGEGMKAQIADVVSLCIARLTGSGGGTPITRH
jgi:hypothetical protein